MTASASVPGRRVFITGGGSGIGATTARTLANRGWKVAVFDRDGAAANAWRRNSATTMRWLTRATLSTGDRSKARSTTW